MYIDGSTDLYATCTTHAASGHLQSYLTQEVLHMYYYTLSNVGRARSGRVFLNLIY